jgi:LmbE family N-acetylglucosaminyl deacetylase
MGTNRLTLDHKDTKNTKETQQAANAFHARVAFFVFFVPLWFNPVLSGQLRGSPELDQVLARLPVTGALLHTGAHPDDEHSTMLSYLARGRHVRTAYLSATRGDGGQNLLGTEQGEALGLLRTQELLDARRLDGAEQFFTRAFDFGFSKSPDEAFAKWGHQEILADFVRIIRSYRPDVVVARFSGTPTDGHGHHQASGILTPEAIHAAADPERFPEQIREGLRVWQVKKFYQTVNRFGPTESDPLPAGILSIDVGQYDPVLGASYNQIGAEGRTLHRSQGFAGFGANIGPSIQGFTLKESLVTKTGADEKDLFDGIDTTLDRYKLMGAAGADVDALKDAVAKAQAQYRPEKPEEIATQLLRGYQLVRKMRNGANADLAFELDLKESQFKQALALAYGWAVEAICEHAEMVPGQNSRVTVRVWNRSHKSATVAVIGLSTPDGWKVETAEFQSAEIGYNQSAQRSFTVTPPTNAKASQPYWLESGREKDRFVVADPAMIGRPESPALMTASVSWLAPDGNAEGGIPVSRSTPVIARLLDPIYGQREVRVNVVPAVAAWTDPQTEIFTPGAEHEISVRLRNNSQAAASGRFSLTVPEGWSVEPAAQAFTIAKYGEESSYSFKVRPGAKAKAGVAAVPEPYSTGYQVVNYPHIVPQYWFHPAQTRLRPIDVQVAPNRKVGYIMGPGDEVPGALRQLGVNLTMLGAQDLLSGDLSKYDVIVAGIRTYAVRQDLVAANQRLLDYVNNGGVYVVQYQGNFLSSGQSLPYGPYPLQFGRPLTRVTVEETPVTVLVPDHPLFNTPNKITAADFDGWVQERGLNFIGTWDDHYTPLLACADPGEPSQKGGMLAARYGKGLFLYTAYAWFRQLPAGVPGAYRIWANILSWKP